MVDNTFIQDFKIAERFGVSAIKDTFNRAFNDWKYDIEYTAALYIAVNHLSWYHHDKGNKELCLLYCECNNAIYDYVYSDDNHYTEQELDVFFQITD